MSGRVSVNKRQRELLRKERQAEKLSRRDDRRTKRHLVDVEPPVAPAPLEVTDAGATLDPKEVE